jgi:hypothetical protein
LVSICLKSSKIKEKHKIKASENNLQSENRNQVNGDEEMKKKKTVVNLKPKVHAVVDLAVLESDVILVDCKPLLDPEPVWALVRGEQFLKMNDRITLSFEILF